MPDAAGQGPRRRRHRRVVRPGTAPQAGTGEAPAPADRAPDDADLGWDRPAGEQDERDDDWYRRERPPHW